MPVSRLSRLYEVMDLMLDSVGDPLALGSLAASASYSSYHFDRIFRELTGFSAVEYQRKRRLRRAAHLLRHEPDVPVGRIAQDCGFPSNAAFAKAFRQQFGMPARTWRDGGWRIYMDAQVGRESDVSFFVAESGELTALRSRSADTAVPSTHSCALQKTRLAIGCWSLSQAIRTGSQ